MDVAILSAKPAEWVSGFEPPDELKTAIWTFNNIKEEIKEGVVVTRV